MIELEQPDRDAAGCRKRFDPAFDQPKMLLPALVTRMEEPNQQPCFGGERTDVAALVLITQNA